MAIGAGVLAGFAVVKRVLGKFCFPVEIARRPHGQTWFIGGNAIPKKVFHHHFAFFVEFHTFFFEHLLLDFGTTECKARCHTAILEHYAMARDRSRFGARRGVST